MSFTPVARILPVGEWEALAGPLGVLNPEVTRIVVVEDGGAGGRLLARWAATTAVHLDGLEIQPDAQRHPGVLGALLTEMVKTLLEHGVREVLAQVDTETMTAVVTRVGGRPLPGVTYVVPVGEAG